VRPTWLPVLASSSRKTRDTAVLKAFCANAPEQTRLLCDTPRVANVTGNVEPVPCRENQPQTHMCSAAKCLKSLMKASARCDAAQCALRSLHAVPARARSRGARACVRCFSTRAACPRPTSVLP